MLREQARDVCDAVHVRVAIGARVAEALREVEPDLVTIEANSNAFS